MGAQALQCCSRTKDDRDEDETLDSTSSATNVVELAASKLFSIPALASAYHTSVLVNGEEFFFSDSGIFSDRALSSHAGMELERKVMGTSKWTGSQLLRVLSPHFKPGTYDLLRKNCNAFSDCALYFLLQERLEGRFSALERLGQSNTSLVQSFTKGAYSPNPVAENFKVSEVIAAISKADPNDPGPQGEFARVALVPGARVTIIGLQNAMELNDQGAIIVRYNAVNGRWEAQLFTTGETKAFRAENLRPAGELALEAGRRVRIHSLQSETGSWLNGRQGVVQRYLHDVSRYEVALVAEASEAGVVGESKALKAENLQAL
jgi:hypothetical protein